jgi:hypothetical protein
MTRKAEIAELERLLGEVTAQRDDAMRVRMQLRETVEDQDGALQKMKMQLRETVEDQDGALQKMKAQRDELAAQLAQATRLAAEIPEPPRREFTEEQIKALRHRWPQIVCAYCGNYHPGMCPCVEFVALDPTGRYPVRIRTRETFQFSPQTVFVEDVWASPADIAEAMETAAFAAQAQKRREDMAAEATKPRQRRPSPREVLNDITGADASG